MRGPIRLSSLIQWSRLRGFIGGVIALFIFNEYLIYYLVLMQCDWPTMDEAKADMLAPNVGGAPLRAIMLADPHLLGSREGHWFDQLRREWQMERAFKTLMSLHTPDIVFILGDVLDEGKWCDDEEFQVVVERFHRMFTHSDDSDVQVVVGNHDIGFHYMITDVKRRRFSRAFKAPSVRMLRIRDNIFVLINSMALEGDRCEMCRSAERELRKISHSLHCAQDTALDNCDEKDRFPYIRPIILQHYPMYRQSDSNCTGPDSAPPREKYAHFREKFDCLSKEASNQLFSWLNPRLIVSGHTHHFCHRFHPDGTPEWTVPSFSWRNKNNPSVLLTTISNNNYAIAKCYLPQEDNVVFIYIIAAMLLLIYLLFPRRLVRYAYKME